MNKTKKATQATWKALCLWLTIFTVTQISAFAEGSSVEKFAKFHEDALKTMQISVSNEGILLLEEIGYGYTPVINKKGELDIEKAKASSFTQKEPRDLLTEEEKKRFPKNDNTHFLTNHNEDYIMIVYKVDNEDKIRIEGRIKNSKELQIIREIRGRKLGLTKNHFRNYHYFGFFVTDEDSLCSAEKGQYLALINTEKATITEYNAEFSLSARPNLYSDEIIFLGLDNHIYSLKECEDRGILPCKANRIWENIEGRQVIDFGKSNDHSFVKLRGYGQDIYKFYTDQFSCELSTETNIVTFEYINTIDCKIEDDINDYDKCGSVALVIEDDGLTLPKAYLRRFYYSSKKPFAIQSVNMTLSPVETLGILDNLLESAKEEYKNSKSLNEFICKFDPNSKKLKFQSKHINFPNTDDEVNADSFVFPYVITIENPKDGTKIPVNVWPAKDASTGNPKPLIIHVHGGPDAHEDIDFNAIKQYLANQGYWVVCPETRGSTGYGKAHETALINHWGDNHIDDIIAVTEVFKKESAINPNAVFLMGSSFGGYSALAAATREDTAGYFDGYISIAGLADVGKGVLEFSQMEEKTDEDKENALRSWTKRIGFEAHNDDRENRKKNKAISPIYRVKNIKKPILLIHGKNDTRVLPNQSEDFFYRALYSKNPVPVHAVLIDDMDHYYKGVPGFYGYAELSLKFFNEILAKGKSSFPSDRILETDNIQKLIEEHFESKKSDAEPLHIEL